MTKRYLATLRCGGYEASFAFDGAPTALGLMSMVADAVVDDSADAMDTEVADALTAELRNMPVASAVREIQGDLYIGRRTRVIVRRFYDTFRCRAV